MSSTPILVAIFNGGASSRFGSDKSVVVVRTRPLLVDLIEVALELSPHVVVIGRQPPFAVSVPVLADADPGAGPLGALLQAFAFAPQHAVLCLPCDLARLTSAHLRLLAAPLPGGSDGRVLVSEVFHSPLPAFYGPTAASAFLALHASGQRALYRALPGMQLETLTSNDIKASGLDPRGLNDFDSPTDLEQLR